MKRLYIAFIFALLPIIAGATNDSLNVVTMVNYEQRWSDSEGTLALRNNGDETIESVEFLIIYYDMKGNMLDNETFTCSVAIEPGMTKKVNIPGYEHRRHYSYYTSEASYSEPHKFKIKFELKRAKFAGEANEEQANENVSYGYSDSNNDQLASWVIFLAIAVFLLGLLVCLCSFILVGFLAKRYKRSALLWVLLAIVTTPFFALILLLIMGEENHHHQAAFSDQNYTSMEGDNYQK